MPNANKCWYFVIYEHDRFNALLCYLCLVFFMLSCLSIAALWSPAGKGLTSWLLFVMFVFLSLSHVVWYLIVLIPDLCHLVNFEHEKSCITSRTVSYLHI